MSLITETHQWIKGELGVKSSALCGLQGLQYNSLVEMLQQQQKEACYHDKRTIGCDPICHINRRVIVQLKSVPFVTTGNTSAMPLNFELLPVRLHLYTRHCWFTEITVELFYQLIMVHKPLSTLQTADPKHIT